MQDITAKSVEEFITSNDIPLMATQTKLCIPSFSGCVKRCYIASNLMRLKCVKN